MTGLPNSLAARDIASLIHPYTNLEKHKVDGPLVIARGEGVYVYDEAGKRYLEGMAGLWSTSLGFSEKRLVEAAQRQMEQLPTYHIFNSRSTEPSIEAAEELLKIVPKGLGKVLFANSGSEANDQAAKIVWFYNNALGRPRKKRIIGRVRGYHGITVFSGSMTGLPANHNEWDLPVGGVLRTDCPSHYLYGRPGESEAQFIDRLVANLEDMIVREGPDTIGAFIAEPVNGAGGVIVPPADYFPRIQQVLRKYDVLMIADEVICGFGRTGEMFGCDTFGIEPDIMTVAKALSSAYMPISATVDQRHHRRGDFPPFRQARHLRARLYLCRSPRRRGGRAGNAAHLQGARHRRQSEGGSRRISSRGSGPLRRIRWSARRAASG